MRAPPPVRRTLAVAIATYPVVTAATWAMWPWLTGLPIPGRTLATTVVSVPVMLHLVLPSVARAVERALGGGRRIEARQVEHAKALAPEHADSA